MTREEIERQFGQLQVWRRGDERAPHKPLLILFALGQLLRGRTEVTFAEVDERLGQLLREFGPPRQSVHPEYPFWRLQTDGVWEVRASGPMRVREGQTDAKKSELLARDARGAFIPEIVAEVRTDPAFALTLAHAVLDASFPPSLHDDLLAATGLDGYVGTVRRRRDASFRGAVLTAYEQRCAVCGLDVRLAGAQLALDAAHIKWHQAGGPDEVRNGLALCVLHHKLFDRGAFTVTVQRVVELSQHLHGTAGFDVLLRHHGQAIRLPQRPDWLPGPEYLEWHRSQVFRGPPRYLPPSPTV
jgi:putative restriction endonuclease